MMGRYFLWESFTILFFGDFDIYRKTAMMNESILPGYVACRKHVSFNHQNNLLLREGLLKNRCIEQECWSGVAGC
jgi:hypothetical protein